jgi:hypothetical protein
LPSGTSNNINDCDRGRERLIAQMGEEKNSSRTT